MFTKNRIYYQFKSDCLSACPLTVHALLHILNDIQNNGPPCMNWTFVMECWCGLLLPAIKLWKKPFICLVFRQYQAAVRVQPCILNSAPSLMHLQSISEALLHTLMHCISDSACYKIGRASCRERV